ncbi:MAG: isoprenylcysteine carboxylmethyltransferase family protein [Syntrophales bacterium LBB04]|nr:isoprenylcysteine carboxylmethyltransferase family protein [Syntrophales bacterium LBB04]
MLKLSIFAMVTAVLIYVSKASLAVPRSHGFYRFFAWESMLALILLNIEKWFRDPFSIHQIVSWVLLIACIFPALCGFYLLRTIGKPDDRRGDAPMIGFEKTTTLVTVGIYKYIRHPLYASLFGLTWGVFFKDPSWVGGIPALAASIFLVATARAEEAENIRFFGPPYQAYMKQSKMFIPFLF